MIARGDKDGQQPRSAWRWQDTLLLTAILVLGLALRLIKWDASLWCDEVLTAHRTRVSTSGILAQNVYPLYYILAHWARAFFSEETAIRVPSLVAGLGAVVLMYVVGKAMSGTISGCIGALLLATSAFHVEHSQEARYYSLMVLLGLGTAILLHKAVRNGGPWRWLAYGVVVTAGLLNHLLFVLFAVAMTVPAGAWLLFSRKQGPSRTRLCRLGALFLATTLAFVPTITLYTAKNVLRSERQAQAEVSVAPRTEETHLESRAADPEFELEAGQESYVLSPWVYVHYLWIYLFGKPGFGTVALMGVLSLAGVAMFLKRNDPLGWIMLAVLVFLPCVLFIVPVRHFYQPRYFILVVPFTYLLMAEGTSSVANWVGKILRNAKAEKTPWLQGIARWAIVLAVLGLMVPSTVGALTRYYRETPGWEWKTLVWDVLGEMKPGDVVAYVRPASSAWGIDVPADYYFDRLTREMGAPTVRPLKIESPETLECLFQEHPESTFWLIGGMYPGHVPPTPGKDYEGLLTKRDATFRQYQKAYLWIVSPQETDSGAGSDEDPKL